MKTLPLLSKCHYACGTPESPLPLNLGHGSDSPGNNQGARPDVRGPDVFFLAGFNFENFHFVICYPPLPVQENMTSLPKVVPISRNDDMIKSS